MINTLTNAAAAVIRAVPALERPAFALLGLSDTRPFRSLRFRVFKRWAARLPDDRAVRTARLPGGLRMRVDVRDWCGITYVEPAAIEPATTGYLIENLRPGDVYLDVGGNVGYHALRAAARVGPAGKVHCFEPNPRLQGLIRESVRLNGFEGRLELHPVALSDADAELPLFISTDPSNSGLSSLTPLPEHFTAGRLDPAAVVRVRAVTLDRFAAEAGITRADAVKVDVEGAEERVVRGMRAALERLRPRFLVVETFLSSPVCRDLAGLGYRARLLERLNPDPTQGWGNVVFER